MGSRIRHCPVCARELCHSPGIQPELQLPVQGPSKAEISQEPGLLHGKPDLNGETLRVPPAQEHDPKTLTLESGCMFLQQRKSTGGSLLESRGLAGHGRGSPEKEREGGRGLAGKQLRNDSDHWPVGVGTAAFQSEWMQIQVD